jgi:hypothetical protein
MLLNILTSNTTFTINIDIFSTVSELKQLIYKEKGISCENQKIRDCTTYLEDCSLIKSAIFVNNNSLFLFVENT